MKKSILYSIVLFSVVLVLDSCKKDDPKPSKTDLLTAKVWSVTKVEFTASGKTTDVTTDFVTDCEKDDTYAFTKDGKFTLNVGTNLCDPSETNSVGSWAWTSNEKILSLTTTDNGATSTNPWTLVTLTSSSLVISALFDGSTTNTITYTFTGK